MGPVQDSKPQLERALGLASTFFMVTGAVIGSGVFLVASDIAKSVSNPFWGLSTWVVAGSISFMGGLIFAELGTRFPSAGGQYVYFKEAIHPLLGFLFGWTLIFVIQAGSIAAVAIAFARFFERSVSLPISQPAMASLAVMGLTGLNCLGIRKGAAFLDGITFAKIVGIIILALMGVYFPSQISQPLSIGSLPSASAYGVAMIAAFWAFDGWNNLGFVAGEVRNPRRNIPMAMGLGIFAITTLYILANLTYLKFLSIDSIAASSFVAADAAKQILGDRGVAWAALFVSLSALGCANGMILAGARVIYAMAADNKFPQLFATLTPKNHSPNNALMGQMVWTLLLVWSGTYDQLFTYVVFAAFIFYALAGLALILVRVKRLSHVSEIYLSPLFPILPSLYILFCIAFMTNALIEKPVESLAGLGLVCLGIPAYFYFSRTTNR